MFGEFVSIIVPFLNVAIAEENDARQIPLWWLEIYFIINCLNFVSTSSWKVELVWRGWGCYFFSTLSSKSPCKILIKLFLVHMVMNVGMAGKCHHTKNWQVEVVEATCLTIHLFPFDNFMIGRKVSHGNGPHGVERTSFRIKGAPLKSWLWFWLG